MTADAAKKAPAKPKAPAAHPKYSVMIAAAITALKAGIKKGSLKMAKESGKGAGKFKLVKVEKPKKVKKVKKAVKPKKPAVKKVKKAVKPKKPAAKPAKKAP